MKQNNAYSPPHLMHDSCFILYVYVHVHVHVHVHEYDMKNSAPHLDLVADRFDWDLHGVPATHPDSTVYGRTYLQTAVQIDIRPPICTSPFLRSRRGAGKFIRFCIRLMVSHVDVQLLYYETPGN